MDITPNPPLIEYVKPILSQNMSNIDTHPLLRKLLRSLASGRKPSQDLFTDDKHYSFFLDTIMRQLNTKTYTKVPDRYRYRYRECLDRYSVIKSMYSERYVYIFYDPRYVMFLFNADMICFEYRDDSTIEKDHLGIRPPGYPRTYLVGVNDDGKLFTIRVIPNDEAERLEIPGIVARNEYAWLLSASDITKLNTTVSSNIVHRAPSKDILIYSRGTYRVHFQFYSRSSVDEVQENRIISKLSIL